MSLPLEQIQGIVLLLVVVCLNLPMSIYCGYRLYKNWDENFLKKRRRSIIVSIYFLLCWDSLITFGYFGITGSANVYERKFLLSNIIYLSAYLTRFLFGSFAVLRIYLLYFDYEYARIINNTKWQILIDPTIEQTNWFILNRQKYGDHIYLTKYVLLPSVIAYYLLFFVYRYSILLNYGFSFAIIVDYTWFSLFVAICCFVGWYYWHKYPDFNDRLLIRQDIKWTIRTALISIIILVMISITFIAIDVRFTFIGSAEINLMYFTLLYIMIIYPQQLAVESRKTHPFRKIKSFPMQKIESEDPTGPFANGRVNTVSFDNASTTRSNVSSITSQTSVQPSHERYLTVDQVIGTKEGFESFASFLEKEFATENLLFVTEYKQMKRAMKQNVVLKEKLKEAKLNYSVHLPDGLPLSLIAKELEQQIKEHDAKVETVDETIGIVFNDEKAKMDIDQICCKAMHKLYSKYIDPNSASLQVNICYESRKTLSEMFQNNANANAKWNMIEIIEILEKAAKEISYLMNDSNARFRKTTIYGEITRKNTH